MLDLLVIGSGVAGCTAALQAADQGRKVMVLTATKDPLNSNSYWAQGGIIYKARDEPTEEALLSADVHRAGAGLCDSAAVAKLVAEGPAVVDRFLLPGGREAGAHAVPFDRGANGELSLCLEASHNRPRIIHWRDETGKAIMEKMVEALAAHPNIELRPGSLAIDLVLEGHPGSERCGGALVLNPTPSSGGSSLDGGFERVAARATVLATGGCGDLWEHTSNPSGCRGDGLAMAIRAGAKMAKMEFMQFHPTTLFIPGERRFLLTEALRGEGAILLDPRDKKPFAKGYHPDGELAPRDVVARMILAEMDKAQMPFALLDISHRGKDFLEARFPAIYAHCKARGLDMAKEPLPVVPAAHYFIGGVEVDLEGRTSVPGLLAAGEAASTGLHGANRLASTSLLEGLVWGAAAADAAPPSGGGGGGEEGASLSGAGSGGSSPSSVGSPPENANKVPPSPPPTWAGTMLGKLGWTVNAEQEGELAMTAEDTGPTGRGHRPFDTASTWATVREAMWSKLGVKRSPKRMAAAASEIAQIARAADAAFEYEFARCRYLSTAAAAAEQPTPPGGGEAVDAGQSVSRSPVLASGTLAELIALRNGAVVAAAIAKAAAANGKSVGTHCVVPDEEEGGATVATQTELEIKAVAVP
mmetsp:Transcript_51654/g.117628  ORF Transcript_51654/g.117628 Transcript_51654/m.117628 type:complete len:643 (+) Transcript_51654:380-2308(+)|eukprot:CAMPEP_0172587304 /NCGR_PEP_ID=MMETSP1068-20121228/6378_1 /TAXON_ID=35684 /ORGANISM="Pseudopedinella elastica, Strain CCMP716" /LENGTH=642 /DNA_ID=CAMNT_0013382275 /DNA_START=274 /DNA_END=2202 /DNA_ORIENTATION=-